MSLLVLGGVLYISGAGGWLTDRIAKLPQSCYAGLSGQQAVCAGVEKVSAAVVSAANYTGAALDGITGRNGGGSLPSSLPTSANFNTASVAAGVDLSQLRMPDWANLNTQALSQKLAMSTNMQGLMRSGPSVSLGSSLNGNQQLRGAVERFALGNQFANPASVNYSPAKALSWHQQGAQFGAYGFGSQMALGSAYSQGWGGQADTQAATRYLQQALASLESLASSNDPQAQQYLHSFGASPDAMRDDIINQIRAIKNR